MTWAVRLEDVSKRYRGGAGMGCASLRNDLARLGRRATAVFRRRAGGPKGFLALDDVTFDVGDIVDWQIVGGFQVTNGVHQTAGPAAVSFLGTDAPIHVEYEWQW
jgi:hypothetical protein